MKEREETQSARVPWESARRRRMRPRPSGVLPAAFARPTTCPVPGAQSGRRAKKSKSVARPKKPSRSPCESAVSRSRHSRRTAGVSTLTTPASAVPSTRPVLLSSSPSSESTLAAAMATQNSKK